MLLQNHNFFPAYRRLVLSLLTNRYASRIRTLEVHVPGISALDFNSALRSTPGLKSLVIGQHMANDGFDPFQLMHGVECKLEQLRCEKWSVSQYTIGLFSSNFGSQIVDLSVRRCSVNPGETTLPRLQILSVVMLTNEALELVARRRVRRFHAKSVWIEAGDLTRTWDTYNLRSIASLSWEGLYALSVEYTSCPNIRCLHVWRMVRFNYLSLFFAHSQAVLCWND